jgi:hypothetical protein
MKKTILLITVIFLAACSPKISNTVDYKSLTADLLNEIKEESLKKNLYTIASDEMQGRETGSTGQKKAGEYMIDFYKKNNISFPTGATTFYQPIPASYFKKAFSPKLPDSENIWAFIKGSEKPDEILVISAHYDHVGMKNDIIFNGADDDASGTVAVLEIAKAFQVAINKGYKPKRSILFLHVTAEEHGLHGSRFYSENPLFPINQHITNINIDMVGRRGYGKEKNDNYIYVIGSNRLSTDLHKMSEEVNKNFTNLELDYTYNDLNDPNRFYYRSDHYNFAKKGIPAIFYFNGVHDDYHKETDTPDKIDYPQLTKRTKLAFALAWELANCAERPKVDKDGK